MNARAFLEQLRAAAAETCRYWYYVLPLYAFQVGIISRSAAELSALLPVLGLSAGFLFLFAVIVGDPGLDRGMTNLLVAAKIVGYSALVSLLIGVVNLAISVSPVSASAGLRGGIGAIPPLFTLIAARLTTDATYWTTVALVLLFFMGAYRLATHGRLRTALRDGPRIFLHHPVQTGAAVVAAFLLVYLPMMVLGAVVALLQLPTVQVMGSSIPGAVLVVLAGTSLGGLMSMRFLATVADQLSGMSDG